MIVATIFAFGAVGGIPVHRFKGAAVPAGQVRDIAAINAVHHGGVHMDQGARHPLGQLAGP